MSQHPEDSQHSSENPSHGSEEESVELSETGGSDAKQKKKTSPFLIIGGVVFLAAAGLVGWRILTASHQHSAPPPPRPAMSAPVPKDGAVHPPVAPTPLAAPASTPIVPTMSASDVAAAPGLPNMNASPASDVATAPPMGAPSSPSLVTPSVPSAPLSTSPTVAPNVSSAPSFEVPSVPSPSVPPQAPLSKAPSPSLVTPSAPITVSQGTDNPDLNRSMSKLSDQMGSLESTLKSLITNTNDKLDTTNQKVDTLSARVDKLEARAGIKTASVADTSSTDKADKTEKTTTKTVEHHRAAPVHHRTHVRHDTTANTVELLGDDTGTPVVSRHVASHQDDVLFTKSAPANVVEKIDAAPANPGFTVKAVLPGRAYVQSADGTSSTYAVGDSLPDGRKVGRIDPDAGVFDSHGHRLPQG